MNSPYLILVEEFPVSLLRAHQHPLVNIILLIILYLIRLCLLVFPIPCEESLHPLMVYCMSIEKGLCWSPWFLLILMTVCPSVSNFHSHWYILLFLFLPFVFDGHYLYISIFSLCVPFYHIPNFLCSFQISTELFLLCSLVKEFMSRYFNMWL